MPDTAKSIQNMDVKSVSSNIRTSGARSEFSL